MKILITGISGFLASYLVNDFEKKGNEIIGISHEAKKATLKEHKLFTLHLPDKEIYKVIKDEQPDVVIHAAGTASVPISVESPYNDFSISVPGTAMLLDAIRLYKPDAHFIFLSSAAVYGNPDQIPIKETSAIHPISPYGFHKRMGELLCEEYATIYGINCSILRVFSAYGKGLKRQVVYDIVSKFVKALEAKSTVTLWGTGKESRDFIHALDVAQAINLIINNPKEGNQIYNCASGNELSIQKLAEIVNQQMGKEVDYQFNQQTRKGDPLNWVADISRLSTLGFNPTVSIESGIKEIVHWINR